MRLEKLKIKSMSYLARPSPTFWLFLMSSSCFFSSWTLSLLGQEQMRTSTAVRAMTLPIPCSRVNTTFKGFLKWKIFIKLNSRVLALLYGFLILEFLKQYVKNYLHHQYFTMFHDDVDLSFEYMLDKINFAQDFDKWKS